MGLIFNMEEKMKKLFALILVMVFVLSACGSSSQSEPSQTESQGETSTSETTTQEESVAETQGDDIRDDAALRDYFYELYKVMADADNIQDQEFVNSNLSFTYSDYNFDDQEDVICYSESPSSSFSEVAVITVIDGKFTTLPNEIEPIFVYTQKFTHRMNSDFLVRTYTGGGSGISSTSTQIYHMATDRIYNTNAILTTEGHVSMPGANIQYAGEVFDMSYKVTDMDEEWLMFEYDYSETDVDKNVVTYSKSERYEFNEETHEYVVTLLDENAESGSAGEATASAGFYMIDDLKPGQEIGEFNVESAYNNVNSDAGFFLECYDMPVTGTLTYDNEMWYEFKFTPDSPLISEPIRISVDGINYDFDGTHSGTISNTSLNSFLTTEEQSYVKSGNSIKVQVDLTGFGFGFAYYSEGGGSYTITSLQVISGIEASGAENSSSQKLTTLSNETFYNIKQGEFVINYPSYRLVVIPMFRSINYAPERLVEYEGDSNAQLKFTVFGKLEDVKVYNIFDMEDPGDVEYLGNVENEIIIVNASLPSDMAYVKVTGKYNNGDGTYTDVEFTMDDMRALEEYSIIVIE